MIRKMSLPEFAWKLCATAAFCFVVSYLATVSMFFVPDTFRVRNFFVIAYVVSFIVALAGALLAIVGHAWNRWRPPPLSK
jgi:hypothetical protein